MKYDYLFKIVLAGDSNTGKTHFFNLLSDKNIDYLSSTIGTDLIVYIKNYLVKQYVLMYGIQQGKNGFSLLFNIILEK